MVELPPGWTVTGNERLLDAPLLGLVSSVQCPGSVIVQLLEAMRAIRSAGITVIGGFHSPVERECLELLLAGTQPIVLVQARATRRLTPSVRAAMDMSRLAVLSPRESTAPRMSRALANDRNKVIAQLAWALLVPYAAPGGATEALALKALADGKQVQVLSGASNERLIAAGAAKAEPTELDLPVAPSPTLQMIGTEVFPCAVPT